MNTYAVVYTYGGDPSARDHHRPRHKDFLARLHEDGRLRVSGPLASEGRPGALLIIEGESTEDVARLMDGDPFQQEGLIASRSIDEWTIVFGGIR